jgi:hypothetical protein
MVSVILAAAVSRGNPRGALLVTGEHRLTRVQSAATSVYLGSTGITRVAVTLDCGADRGYADSILNTLASNGIKAASA